MKMNGKKVLSLALVPFIGINMYVGSKMLKNRIVEEKEDVKPNSSITQMVDMEESKQITINSQVLGEEVVVKEGSIFEKLQQVYLASKRNFNEILEHEDRSSELYASALYAKLKSANLDDSIIRSELDNILMFSLTFTDMDNDTWLKLFGNCVSTINEDENVMDYYYPLAIYIHKQECDLVHTGHEFDESRMTCSTLETMASSAFTEVSYCDYVIDMINASEDDTVINQYNRIINAGVNFNDALTELDSIYALSQIPMCIDEESWNTLFKNLLTTVTEYDNVFEVYGELAYYVHALNCDYNHYIDEYGVNVCEGMKLQYK